MTTHAAPGPTDGDVTPTAEPGSQQGRGFLPALGIANATVWLAFFTPLVLTLPQRVETLAPGSKAETLSVVLLISSVFGLVANPLSGSSAWW